MALFRLNDIERKETPALSDMVADQSGSSMIVFKKNDELQRLLPALNKDICLHFVSGGVWSAHDLLFHILALTGPAKVYISTWTATETPVRMLTRAVEEKNIQELNLLFDMRMPHRTPAVYNLAKMNCTRIRMDRVHAKVTVIENKDWCVSINSSQNFTNNPRIECGVISTSVKVGQFHRDWIMKVIMDAKPFENE